MALCLALGPAFAFAEAAAIKLRDINDVSVEESSFPRDFTRSGDLVFFTAATRAFGRELWRTDATERGTRLVKDLAPGDATSFPSALVDVNGALYFRAQTNGQIGLWKTDGTSEGTVRVFNHDAHPIIGMNGTLLFRGFSPSTGYELWKTDGTVEGTSLVKDVWEGPNTGVLASAAASLDGGAVVFAANDGVAGESLWRTDGTEAGTYRVTGLPAAALPYRFVTAGGRAYFGGGAAGNTELYETDGTSEGTRSLGSRNPRSLTPVGQALYFVAEDADSSEDLWKHDGSGTLRLADFAPTTSYPGLGSLSAVGDRLYFTSAGRLWVSDGTPETTHELAYNVIVRTEIADLGGAAVFGSFDQLLKSDGTSVGTQVIKFNIGTVSSDLRSSGGKVFFAVSDGSGNEPWVTDATSTGTHRIADVGSATTGSIRSLGSARAGSRLAFGAQSAASGYEPWSTDGTQPGTSMVLDAVPGARDSLLSSFGQVGSGAMFHAYTVTTNAGEEQLVSALWLTDGTAAGTRVVKIVGADYPYPLEPAELGGEYFFGLREWAGSLQLWKTDPTGSTTELVMDFQTPPHLGRYRMLGRLGESLLFLVITGQADSTSNDLWKTSGSTEGTSFVAPLCDECGDPLAISAPDVERDHILVSLVGFGGVQGTLVATDGTAAGTRVLRRFVYPPSAFFELAGLTYFTAVDASFPLRRHALWVTDGTAEGTRLIGDFSDQLGRSLQIDRMALAGASLIFAGVDEGGDVALYRFDPSTELVSIIGRLASTPNELFFDEALGTALFTMGSETTGVELWQTTGDLAGIRFVQDVAPGLAHSNPRGFARVGKGIFFVADDGTGNEPWFASDEHLEVEPPSIACPADQFATGWSSTHVSAPPATATDAFSTPMISYEPLRETAFELGTTIVTAVATDHAGNSASCTYAVTVSRGLGCGCAGTGDSSLWWSVFGVALLALRARRPVERSRSP